MTAAGMARAPSENRVGRPGGCDPVSWGGRERICSIEGCTDPLLARGWCGKHYARWRRLGDPVANGDRLIAPDICTVAGCENPYKSRGFCPKHLDRWKRHGDPLYVRPKPVCAIDGCCDLARARGWCVKHYNRWFNHGDPEAPVNKPNHAPTCDAPGCSKPSPGSRWCSMHYERMKRNGHLGRQTRTRHLHSMGYVFVKAAGHPLANSKGWIYEHRLVLFAKIGPGDHPCHWCGMTVSWDLSYPDHQAALVSDHLDDDRGNNDPSNLVPSCALCNLQRSDPLGKRYGRATK